ncbi:formiminotetrahydrofolate cyclodeaminase [Halorubrum aquaticum]|uniref:Formiminotetrahydrofolate cyclodeaminase n=1 Tax=Halorubrum aquaticum TaxID=387340 RepID=A0A1I3C4N7_9EURY|nr:cyclodeaminase/cyclohydrolase family protein [Halorubrum aquaticum]SFH68951.1 formiminotetrahydrofolate cyclodeaminase [Halorubrum aquaticum]
MNPTTSPIDEFLASVASKRVAPAGGTVAAVAGAMGASLCEMVCIHTLENDEYAAVSAETADLREEFRRRRGRLLDLAAADATVVEESFSEAAGELERSDRKRSVGVPLAIADACGAVLESAVTVIETGNRNAVADAATGAFLVDAALRSALFTARENLSLVSDPSSLEETERRLDGIESRADDARERAAARLDERT